MTKKEYTKGEVKELFEHATRIEKETPQEAGYSVETVQNAAKEAGISDGQLSKAIRQLEVRRTSRLGLVSLAVVAVIAIGALLLYPSAFLGTGDKSVLLHNDNRKYAHTVEVLVPTPDAAEQSNCNLSPDQRIAVADYCLVKRLRLEPRARVRIKIPQRPSSCPQIWVRVVEDNLIQSSALFTLPAGIEFDKSGHMDQKGLGSPNMHPAFSDSWTESPQCASALSGDAS